MSIWGRRSGVRFQQTAKALLVSSFGFSGMGKVLNMDKGFMSYNIKIHLKLDDVEKGENAS